MTDAPAVKTPRTDTDSRTNEATIRSKIWMPCGNIVLQAESTLFRVNSDVLGQHSTVFRDMFTIPQPPNEEALEGCPIVRVTDSAKDWALLLQELYNPFHCGDTLPMDVVTAMLRLGKKYEMTAVKENALWRIHYEFPNILGGWNERESDFEKIQVKPGDILYLLGVTYDYGVRASIPAMAYKCLSRYSLESIIYDKISREIDGSQVILDKEIKFMLAAAVERMFKHHLDLFQWLADGSVIPSGACAFEADCEERRKEIYSLLTRGTDHDRYFSLRIWDSDGWACELCKDCDDKGEAKFNGDRRKTWEALPSFFGLPKWEDLKDED